MTELRLSVPEAGKRLLPLPVALWHKDVGKRVLKQIAKGDDVLAEDEVVGFAADAFLHSGGWTAATGGAGAPSDPAFSLHRRARRAARAAHYWWVECGYL